MIPYKIGYLQSRRNQLNFNYINPSSHQFVNRVKPKQSKINCAIKYTIFGNFNLCKIMVINFGFNKVCGRQLRCIGGVVGVHSKDSWGTPISQEVGVLVG